MKGLNLFMRNFTKFSCSSMKARIAWTQERLVAKGYLQEGESAFAKRDKPFIKALKKFQEDNGLTTNAEIHEIEFNLLNAG
jgi:hypothetical protein